MSKQVILNATRRMDADLRIKELEKETDQLTTKLGEILLERGFTSSEALALIWPVRFATKQEADKLVEFIQKLRMPPQ